MSDLTAAAVLLGTALVAGGTGSLLRGAIRLAAQDRRIRELRAECAALEEQLDAQDHNDDAIRPR